MGNGKNGAGRAGAILHYRDSENDTSSVSVFISADRAAAVSNLPAPPTPSSAFGSIVLATEAVLAVLVWILRRWNGIDWAAMIHPTVEGMGRGVLGGLGLVTVHLVLVLPGGPRNPLYRGIYVLIRRMLRPWARSTSVVAIVGVAEEFPFRGWLQTQTNVVAASLLFGAAHLWGRGALPYGGCLRLAFGSATRRVPSS